MTQYTEFIEVFFTLKMSHFLINVNDKSPVKHNVFRFLTQNLSLNIN
jgi:hypothetical protein